MKIEGWNDAEIAAEARGLLSNKVLVALLSAMEADATSRIVAQAMGDDAALRKAAVELKVVRDVRNRLSQLGKKEADDGR
jgi:hypothetical protein